MSLDSAIYSWLCGAVYSYEYNYVVDLLYISVKKFDHIIIFMFTMAILQ